MDEKTRALLEEGCLILLRWFAWAHGGEYVDPAVRFEDGGAVPPEKE